MQHCSNKDSIVTLENHIKPWKHTSITEDKFIEQADTGDILLLRGSSLGAKVIRVGTLAKFDHVAMILKFDADPSEVYIIEATTNTGVHLNKWSFLREHIGKEKFYLQAKFRHIDYNRTPKVVENLEIFLKEAIG